jgi:UDP-glucose 4-epimerase
MKVLLTGSAGRIGRALFNALAAGHEVVGLDRQPFATTRFVGDLGDRALLQAALEGVEAVLHVAALHAPHVGLVDEAEFARVNLDALAQLIALARAAGVRRVV